MGPFGTSVLAVAQLLALAAPRRGQAQDVDFYAKAGSDPNQDLLTDCTDRLEDLLSTMIDPGSDDVACAYNTSQDTCPPGCQGNITALLHECINITYMDDTTHREQFWDENAAAQLHHSGPKGCNYSVPARPPQPPPPPPPHSPPSLPPGHGGWMSAPKTIGVAAAAVGGLVAVGGCGFVIKRRNRPDSVREGLLQDVGEDGGSE